MKTFIDCRGGRWNHSTAGHDYCLVTPGSLYEQVSHDVTPQAGRVLFIDFWTASTPGLQCPLAPHFPMAGESLKVHWSPEFYSYAFRFNARHVMSMVKTVVEFVDRWNLEGVLLDMWSPTHTWLLSHGTDPDVYAAMHPGPDWYRKLLMLWAEGYLAWKLGGKVLLTNGAPRSDKLGRWWEMACGDTWHRGQVDQNAKDDDWAWCNSGDEFDWRQFIRHYGADGNEPNIIIGCGYPDGNNTEPPSRLSMDDVAGVEAAKHAKVLAHGKDIIDAMEGRLPRRKPKEGP